MIARKIVGGQLGFPGVPDRQPCRMHLFFRGGSETHRHEFSPVTQLGAVLEMARQQGATTIEIENTPNEV
jgi:hypothetical protein